MPYLEIEELANWLRIGSEDNDGELAVALDAAFDSVASFCGRRFDDAATVATPRVYAAKVCDLLYIDPVANDTDFALAVDTTGDGTFNLAWVAADYQLEPFNRLRAGLVDHPYYRVRAIESKAFPVGPRARVEVTARWGWETVPDSVRTATLMHAGRLHARRNTAAGIAVGESLPTRMAMGLDSDVKSLLAPYVRQDTLWL